MLDRASSQSILTEEDGVVNGGEGSLKRQP